jgi:hypothetical protein
MYRALARQNSGGCVGYLQGSIVLTRFFFGSFLFIDWKRNEQAMIYLIQGHQFSVKLSLTHFKVFFHTSK